jgi:hypothetical protein
MLKARGGLAVSAGLAILVVMILATGCGFAALKPQVVTTIFPTEDIVIATVVVDTVRDGSLDTTKHIQLAIDKVADAGGGVVFLPAGRYLIGHLVVKEGVTLRGDWMKPEAADTPERGRFALGTMLIPSEEAGRADAPPTIFLERGSGLVGITVWYPNQNAEKIEAYPWTIATSPSVGGDSYTIYNVTLVNPYQGIRVGPEWNELHTIRNVYGTPLKTGLSIDTCTDIGRVINVDFGPQWWETSGLDGAPETDVAKNALTGFMLREGVGFDLGRSDWEYLYAIRAASYGVGLKFRAGKEGESNAVLYASQFLDCVTPLLLERLNAIGVSVTRCDFSGKEHAVYAPATFAGVAQFNDCSFVGRFPVALDGPGVFTLQNCRFPAYPEAAVAAARGSVSVLGCDLGMSGAHVKLDGGARRARVLGNQFRAGPKIVNHSRGDVEVANSALEFATIPPMDEKPAPYPKPPNTNLYDVTDFGAGTQQADNSKAFQQALRQASDDGGGTVYVPAGYWRVKDTLEVPTGVELRGCFDVPHHTVSAGSVLLVTAGKGKENGTPFLSLLHHSGLRGLTIWYPEQDMGSPVAYPWTVQSTGPGCWLVDVTMGNSYQGADFWTYPSDGHIIRYLAGCYLRKGLFVSKCGGEGWVEDVQFNPHYAFRLPVLMPKPAYKTDVWGPALNYIGANLEGLVFGHSVREHITRTFLYAARDGLVFRDDGGGTNARVIEHGTDAGGRALVLEAAGGKGLEFINTQLTHFGPYEKAALVVADSFAGRAQFFNTQMWAGPTSAIIGGTGDVLIQQLNSLTGPVTVTGGRFTMENATFSRDLSPHVHVEAGCQAVRLLGNISAAGDFRMENAAGDRCYARGNSAPFPPTGTRFALKTGWEAGEPAGTPNTVAVGGGALHVSGGECAAADTADAHTGKRALRLAGTADDPKYSYAYYKILDGPIDVEADTTLTYWLRPGNENGRHVGVDLLFADGAVLRDLGAKDAAGGGVHPEEAKGTVGQWTKVVVPLGPFAGRTIATVMFAYDQRDGGGGPFEALVDDLSIDSPAGVGPWRIAVSPAAGTHAAGVKIRLRQPEGAKIRYTLDGMSPGPKSPVYGQPIELGKAGLWELRCAVELPDGTVSGRVFAALYEVAGSQ